MTRAHLRKRKWGRCRRFGAAAFVETIYGHLTAAFLFVLALLAGCATDPQELIHASAVATNRVISEQKVAVIKPNTSFRLFQNPGKIPPVLLAGASITTSPDSRHVMWVQDEGGKRFVVVDGTNQLRFDQVDYGRNAFSPDSQHWSCLGKRDGKFYALVDGEETELAEFDHDAGPNGLAVSPNVKRIAYLSKKNGKTFWVVDGQPGPPGKWVSLLRFSPDSQHFFYNGPMGQREVLYQDHHELQTNDFLEALVFDDSGRQMALVIGEGQRPHEAVGSQILRGVGMAMAIMSRMPPNANNDVAYMSDKAKRYVRLDGHDGQRYDKIAALKFSPDGEHLAYAAIRDKACFVVLDGHEQQAFDFLVPNPPVFSADSQHLAFIGGRGGQLFIVVDGNEAPLGVTGTVDTPVFSEAFRTVAVTHHQGHLSIVDGPVLSPDGRHVAVVVREGKHFYLLLDGKQGKSYYAAAAYACHATSYVSLTFSPDGNHVAYWAQGKNYQYKSAVLDGTEGRLWNQILGHIVFDGNDRIHYLATEGPLGEFLAGDVYLVEEKVP